MVGQRRSMLISTTSPCCGVRPGLSGSIRWTDHHSRPRDLIFPTRATYAQENLRQRGKITKGCIMNSGPTLSSGSTGHDVRRLQRIFVMMKVLAPGNITGTFDSTTEQAVKDFQ